MADENQQPDQQQQADDRLGAEEHQTTEVAEQESPQAEPTEETAETEVIPSESNPEQSGGDMYDAPNQQVVGQPHPSEEGTGGEAGSLEQAAGTLEEDEPQPRKPQRASRKAKDE